MDSDAKVVRLSVVPKTPDEPLAPVPEVVALCRKALAQAESGELRGVGIAFARVSGVCGEWEYDAPMMHALFAASHELTHSMQEERDAIRREHAASTEGEPDGSA